MTVATLIELLQGQDPDSEVSVLLRYDGTDTVLPIGVDDAVIGSGVNYPDRKGFVLIPVEA